MNSNRNLAESKLILLYFIERIGMPVSNLQIAKIILEYRFMNYFSLQEYLDDLCTNGSLSEGVVEGRTCYSITQNGKKTLDYFSNLIPDGIKTRIDRTLSTIKRKLRNETSVKADFTPQSENEYIVTCKVSEDDFILIKTIVTVGTREDARDICKNWEKHAQLIYPEIIESLIKKRD